MTGPTAKARLADATRRLGVVRSLLDELTDERLAEVLRRGAMRPRDGFPGATLGGRGDGDDTPTEAAAMAGLGGPADDGELVPPDDWDRHDKPYDPIGDTVGAVWAAIMEMHARAITIERGVAYVLNAGDRRRKFTLGGDCRACGRDVAGGVADPVRSGYCGECGKAWERAGRPDRLSFERLRRPAAAG